MLPKTSSLIPWIAYPGFPIAVLPYEDETFGPNGTSGARAR